MSSNYPQMIWEAQDEPHDFVPGDKLVCVSTVGLLAPMTVGRTYVCEGRGRWHDSIFVKDDMGHSLECKAKRFRRVDENEAKLVKALMESMAPRRFARAVVWEVTPLGIRKVEVIVTEVHRNPNLHLTLEQARGAVTQKPRVQYIRKCIRN